MLSLVARDSVCLMFPKSDSSEFEELYFSILDSVIYKEGRSCHLFLKSVFTNESGIWDRVQVWKLHFSFILTVWDWPKHAYFSETCPISEKKGELLIAIITE